MDAKKFVGMNHFKTILRKSLPALVISLMLVAFTALPGCQSPQPVPQSEILYTCPMPADSFFSDKPGTCPKCGMTLVEIKKQPAKDTLPGSEMHHHAGAAYTCPMHPQILVDTAGTCPICGMELEKVKQGLDTSSISLDILLKPVNRQVIASVPMVHLSPRKEDIRMETYGFIAYDDRFLGSIAANFSGRIEKLYVRYRYQPVQRGQPIMDIYSPELVTAQENLLFLLKNDPSNNMLIGAARQKLLLLGMSERQLREVIRAEKPSYAVSVYSAYSGHIHESRPGGRIPDKEATGTGLPADVTRELPVKEGMYVQKGQTIFSVYNPNRAWAVLNVFAGQAALVKTGNKVEVVPETNPDKKFSASINYLEPLFRADSKTMTARVYFDNSAFQIPIGSQVKASVFAGYRTADWLPEEAVLSLGLDKVVFVRNGESFVARKILTGIVNKHLVQVLSGLERNEAVAANAQYLVDSESFIRVENNNENPGRAGDIK